MLRPVAEVVHRARSGHCPQWALKEALPPPVRAGVIGTVCAAGQVTVWAARSMPNRSLLNSPRLLRIGGTLAKTVCPAVPSLSSKIPVPLSVCVEGG